MDDQTLRNPFQYGRELDLWELVDRDMELAEIASTIRNRGKLFLVGPRRFGKTSLLVAAAQEAEQQGVIVLRFDAEKYETLPLLAQAMLTGAARALKGPVERTLQAITEVASRLRPRFSVDQQGSISVGIEAGGTAELPVLTDALDAIDALAARSGRETSVMIDEVQQIVVDGGPTAEKQLRATIQQHRNTSYILAGSAVRLLSAMTSDVNRPFYRLGARLFLGPLPRDQFTEFLQHGFDRGGMRIEPGALEAILDLCDDVPYNVQRLAHEAWEMMRAGEAPVLTRDVVRDAAEQIVRREDPAYTQVWTQLSRNQKKALKAVITHGGERLQSGAVSAELGIPTSSMQAALKALEDVHLIRPVEERGQARYAPVDPFLAVWLEYAQSV